MRKIAVIGAFGNGSPTSSGQIIRTNITYDEFLKHFGSKRVIKVNTTDAKKNRVRFVLHLLRSIAECDYFFLIVSENGMHTLYPIFAAVSKILHKKVLNSVVGGTLLPIIKAYPKCAEAMNSFVINWVQLPSMIKEAAVAGIKNTEVLPNSKPLEMADIKDYHSDNRPFRFCTFSRVSREKGIEQAIDAIKNVNSSYAMTVATLDIFGQPDTDYLREFEKMQNQFPPYIKYRGVIPYNQTVECLKSYYALIFPTTFDGEGFPGTLVDAFFSGLPVIATDWKHNSEILKHKTTGLIYSATEPNALVENIKEAICNPDLFLGMRQNCLDEAKKYTIESVMDIILKYIED